MTKLTFKLFKVVAFIYSTERVPRTHLMLWPSSQSTSEIISTWPKFNKHKAHIRISRNEIGTSNCGDNHMQTAIPALSARQIWYLRLMLRPTTITTLPFFSHNTILLTIAEIRFFITYIVTRETMNFPRTGPRFKRNGLMTIFITNTVI